MAVIATFAKKILHHKISNKEIEKTIFYTHNYLKTLSSSMYLPPPCYDVSIKIEYKHIYFYLS